MAGRSVKMYPFQRLRLTNKKKEAPTLLDQALDDSKGSRSMEDSYFNQLTEIAVREPPKAAPSVRVASGPVDVSKMKSDVEGEIDLSDAPLDQPSVKDWSREVVYRECIRTVLNYHPGGGEKQVSATALFTHMQRVLGIDEKGHQTFMEKEVDTVKGEQLLCVRVIEARALPPKDENGKSDPFCMMGVVKLSAEQQALRAKGRSMGSVGDITDTTAKTTVRMETLNPMWNEEFLLKFAEVPNHFLQVDVWDYDEHLSTTEALSKASSVKGVAGFGRWVSKIGQTFTQQEDDFIGRTFVPLDSVANFKQQSWYDLESRRNKDIKCDVHLELSFQQGKIPPVDPSWTPLAVYRSLYWEIVRHQALESMEANVLAWDGELSNAAEMLLELFARQHGLTALQRTSVEWCVLAEMHRRNVVSYKCLGGAVEGLSKAWEATSGDAIGLSDNELEMFINSLALSVKQCVYHIKRHHFLFPMSKETSPERFACLFRVLQFIESHKLFKIRKPNVNVKDAVVEAVKHAAQDKVARRTALLQPMEQTALSMAEGMTELVRVVITELEDGKKFYEALFQKVEVDFVGSVVDVYDSAISEKLEETVLNIGKVIESWKEVPAEGPTVSHATFQLFVTVQKLSKLLSERPEGSKLGAALEEFNTMFRPVETFWMEMAEYEAINLVHKTVEEHTAVCVAEDIKYSVSAVDISTTISQVVDFWHKLRLLNPADNTFNITHIIKIISVVIKHYHEKMLTKLEALAFFSSEGNKFSISEELVLVLNSLDFVRVRMRSVEDDVKWEEAAEGLPSDVAAEGASAIKVTLSSTEVTMSHQRSVILGKVVAQMQPDLRKRVKCTMDKVASNVALEEALEDLMVYLKENLQIIYRQLLHGTFIIILEKLWESLLEIFSDLLDISKCGSAEYVERMGAVLEMSMQFFHCEGEGLPMDALDSDTLKDVKAQLSLFNSESLTVVRAFYLALLQRQRRISVEDSKARTVTVRVAYVRASDNLHVKVVSAKNLPSMDAGGKCDPYFNVFLEPVEAFPNAEKKKTSVLKDTLSPTYNELFTFTSDVDLVKARGSAVVLHCIDWDRFTADDFIGEALVDLSSCPVVGTPADVDKAGQLAVLPLRRYPIAAGPSAGIKAYDILASRGDGAAKRFVQLREFVFKGCEECVD